MTADQALAVACALHAGFQVTVTTLVYPALLTVPAERWTTVHVRHSRAITPLVGVVYGALLGAGAWAVASGPGVGGWVALAASAGAMAVTAFGAASLHGRLGPPGPGDRDRVRLVVLDRGRTALAVVGVVAAVVALG